MGLARRDILRTGGVLAAGAAGLWAFLPREHRSRLGIPPGRTVVTYWEKWTGIEGDAVQRVVDAFNASQSRLWVYRLPVSDQNSKAMVAVGGGDPPDVAGLFSYSVPQYAQAGAAMSFDDLGIRISPEHYAPAVARCLTHQGRLFAGANTCYTLALYYNKDHLREAGLDAPSTVPELDATAQALDCTNSANELIRVGLLQTLPWWWPYAWPVLFGDPLYDEAKGKVTIDSPASTASFEWLTSYPRRLGYDRARSFASAFDRSFLSAGDPFLSGRTSMCLQGPWMANFARRFAPDLRFGVTAFPRLADDPPQSPPRGVVECDVLIVPRGAKEPEAAAEFVAFTQKQEVQEALCQDHCKPSPLASVSESFVATHPHAGIAVHNALVSSPAAVVLPRIKSWKEYAVRTQTAFDAIWRGAPPGPTLGALATSVQRLVDRETQLQRQRDEPLGL